MRYHRPRRNPMFSEGDPLAIIDSYLDTGVYPGDEAIDDLMVAAEMYVEHYWREVEDFEPPGDLQNWVGDIPEVIEAWQNLTAEDAIVFYQEMVRKHCENAKVATTTWWMYLTYLQGLLVLGDDRVADIVVDVSDRVWEHWMPNNQCDPPPWECITRTALRQGVLDRVKGCEARRRGLWAQADDFAPIYIHWQGPVGVFNEAGYQLFSFWYRDEFPELDGPVTPMEHANPMQQANRRSFEKYLAGIPYFDCQWCAKVREVIISLSGQYPGVTADRRDFFLQLRRPSGYPTLLAYVYDWFWDIATMEDRGEDRERLPIPFDEELYNELVQDLQAAFGDQAWVEEPDEDLTVGHDVDGLLLYPPPEGEPEDWVEHPPDPEPPWPDEEEEP